MTDESHQAHDPPPPTTAQLGEELLDALKAVMIMAGYAPTFVATRAVAIVEIAHTNDADQTLVVLTTTIPAWTALGLIKGAEIQMKQLVIGALWRAHGGEEEDS